MNGDNKILNVNGEGLDRLKAVMALSGQRVAVGYAVEKNRIVFFWTSHEKMVPFPSRLPMDRVAEVAYEWLKETAEYPPEPDHDGDNKRGWYCLCDEWGHVRPFGFCAFLAVIPQWIMYGK